MKQLHKLLVCSLLFWTIFGLWGSLPEVQAKTAQEGEEGDKVLAIQLRLIDLGYNIPKATGFFDARTARAVMTYQK